MLCRALNRRSLFQSMDNTPNPSANQSMTMDAPIVERSRFDEIKVDLENAFDDLTERGIRNPDPEPVTPECHPKTCDDC